MTGLVEFFLYFFVIAMLSITQFGVAVLSELDFFEFDFDSTFLLEKVLDVTFELVKA